MIINLYITNSLAELKAGIDPFFKTSLAIQFNESHKTLLTWKLDKRFENLPFSAFKFTIQLFSIFTGST